MKPICVPCQRFFRVKKNDFFFIEGAPRDNRTPPGTAAPEMWHPYKLWAADRYECEGCGHVILSGFGREPIAIQHEPNFAKTVAALRADQFQVNDC
jgi:hypothetical protein